MPAAEPRPHPSTVSSLLAQRHNLAAGLASDDAAHCFGSLLERIIKQMRVTHRRLGLSVS